MMNRRSQIDEKMAAARGKEIHREGFSLVSREFR